MYVIAYELNSFVIGLCYLYFQKVHSLALKHKDDEINIAFDLFDIYTDLKNCERYFCCFKLVV